MRFTRFAREAYARCQAFDATIPPIPRTSVKTGRALRSIEYVWHRCVSCGERSVMPLKRDGTVGTQGAAWTYGKCPMCGKVRK